MQLKMHLCGVTEQYQGVRLEFRAIRKEEPGRLVPVSGNPDLAVFVEDGTDTKQFTVGQDYLIDFTRLGGSS